MLKWAMKCPEWASKAQYLLFPSVYELESQVIDALKTEIHIPIYTIGSLIPYHSLQHQHKYNNHNDQSYFQWLDAQPSGSVLYISQGSFLSVSKTQLREIAAGLRESGVRFLWVAREENVELKKICGNMGLVLAWCDQLRVLSHSAIGGFWSHCGWSSTNEGVFAGVPFLTFPIIMDQPLNSKLIVEDWKIGWRVKKDIGKEEDRLVKREEVAGIVKKFMDLNSNEGRDMRERVRQLQRIIQVAVENGGSSESNINAFLRDIVEFGKS